MKIPNPPKELNRIEKQLLLFSLAMITLSVILGALGAHALKSLLSSEQLESFQTAVRYQGWQSMGLLVMLIANRVWDLKLSKTAFRLLISGIVLFSTSIYILVLIDSPGFYRMIIGPLTPIGGILMITAWLWFFIHILRSKVLR